MSIIGRARLYLLIAYFRTRSGRIATPHQRAWADIEGAIRGKTSRLFSRNANAAKMSRRRAMRTRWVTTAASAAVVTLMREALEDA